MVVWSQADIVAFRWTGIPLMSGECRRVNTGALMDVRRWPFTLGRCRTRSQSDACRVRLMTSTVAPQSGMLRWNTAPWFYSSPYFPVINWFILISFYFSYSFLAFFSSYFSFSLTEFFCYFAISLAIVVNWINTDINYVFTLISINYALYVTSRIRSINFTYNGIVVKLKLDKPIKIWTWNMTKGWTASES